MRSEMMMLRRIQCHVYREKISNLVDRIVARGQNSVWHRVQKRIRTLTADQARGYVRARAAHVIDREMGIVCIEQPELNQVLYDAIVMQVRQRLIEVTIQQARRLRDARTNERRRAA